jgi:arsenate reductase (thioredoxin)
MAEALARHFAADIIEATSAGISPLGRIAELTRKTLREKGIEADALESKSIRQAAPDPPELLINMTGIPGRSLFPGMMVEDWNVEDPYGEDIETYRRICEDIEARIEDLAVRLRMDVKTRAKKS